MSHPSSDQKLWKVQVMCEGIIPPEIGVKKPLPERPVRNYITVILLAEDGNAAMEAGKDYADSNAPGDVRWKCFTPLNAARFVLPIALQEL